MIFVASLLHSFVQVEQIIIIDEAVEIFVEIAKQCTFEQVVILNRDQL
jgi:hypothetical protein